MLLTFILVCLCTELTASIYGVILNMIINSISILIILPIIPIENPNKKLDAKVKQKNKKIGIIVTSLFNIFPTIAKTATDNNVKDITAPSCMLYTVNTIESIANKLVTIIPIFLFFCFTFASNFLLGFSIGIIGNGRENIKSRR